MNRKPKRRIDAFSIIVACLMLTLAGSAFATGEREPIDIDVVDVEVAKQKSSSSMGKAFDPKASRIQIHSRSRNIQGIELKRTLYLEDGSIFEIAFGNSIMMDEKSTSLDVEGDLPTDIPDGYYAEKIEVVVSERGRDDKLPVRKYRYFRVIDGYFTPISIKEYSEAVIIHDSYVDKNGRQVKEARGSSEPDPDYWTKAAECEKSPEKCRAEKVEEEE